MIVGGKPIIKKEKRKVLLYYIRGVLVIIRFTIKFLTVIVNNLLIVM